MMKEIMKDKKVIFAVTAFIVLGVLPLAFKGIDYGMDFKGGTLIQVNIEKTANQTIDSQTIINVLQNRVNSFGLKDVNIKPWGNPVSYIIVEIAETNPQAINQIESLLGQQGKFETLYKGKVVLKGSDIVSVITDPQQGYGFRPSEYGYRWTVPFLITSKASQDFSQALLGQCSTPNAETCPELLYMFIDRPAGAYIIMPHSLYDEEKNVPNDLDMSTDLIPINELVNNSGVHLIVADNITQSVLDKVKSKQVIIPQGNYSNSSIALLQKYASKVTEKGQVGKYWIADALNLENIVHITPGIAAGTPVTRPSITGSAQTQQQAAEEMNRVVILLKSGKLPVSVNIGSVSTISPTLGSEFLKYSFYAALIAMLVVALSISVRYKRIKVTFPILTTLVFEITMILGISSLIGWQMDLPSVAGIIAAIGSGVDDQIIIVDEVLRKETEEEKLASMASKIKKAFAIVFMSAGALTFAMAPLLFMGLGVLKGFAITTIIGVFVGVFITRPAYASIVKRLID